MQYFLLNPTVNHDPSNILNQPVEISNKAYHI